jgi:hypothetical protein
MAKETQVISHWYQLIEEFQASSQAFYESLAAAIARRQVPDTESSRIEFKEGGLLTANRQYLHIIRGKHAFDVCAAPFGTGFFFSWWLTELPPGSGILYFIGVAFVVMFLMFIFFQGGIIIGCLLSVALIPFALWAIGSGIREGTIGGEDVVLSIPYLGAIYERIFKPTTYYKIDTALMFQEAIRNAVIEVIDQMTTAKGLRALSEAERKPVMKRLAQSA